MFYLEFWENRDQEGSDGCEISQIRKKISTPKEGHQSNILANFQKNCIKMKIIGSTNAHYPPLSLTL